RRRHTRFSRDWSSDVCSSDLPGAHAVADGFDQRLGEQAAEATEGVGGLEGGLVYLAFEPAVVNQAVEDPAGLFAVVAEAPLVVIVALEQGRAFQCFAEDVQHLFALERLAVVGAGAVQAVVQQAQAFDDLFAVLAGQWFEELQALVGEEHRASGAGESAAYYAACGQGFEFYLVGDGRFLWMGLWFGAGCRCCLVSLYAARGWWIGVAARLTTRPARTRTPPSMALVYVRPWTQTVRAGRVVSHADLDWCVMGHWAHGCAQEG